MSVSRKVLLAALSFFALSILVLVIGFSVNSLSRLNYETELTSGFLKAALDAQLAEQEDLALALASQFANNTEVKKALADSDRERLFNVTYGIYQNTKSLFNISQLQFHSPPATVFLRLQTPEIYGEDQSTTRLSVFTANKQKGLVSGIELSTEGLLTFGIVPVTYDGEHIGTSEIGISIDKNILSNLKTQYNADYQILLSRDAIDRYGLESIPIGKPGPTENTFLQVSSMTTPIFASRSAYEETLNGEATTSDVQVGSSRYQILSIPVRDFSGNIIGVIDIINDRTSAITELRNRIAFLLIVTTITLILAGFGLTLVIRRIFQPIADLTNAAIAITHGDLSHDIPTVAKTPAGKVSPDEIEQLVLSFNEMTRQLRSIFENMEARISSRTQDLERNALQLQVAAEIVRDIIGATDMDILLRHAANLIFQRFKFYHVNIYLLDANKEFAVLRAATGEAGRLMVATNQRLVVGSQGIVGAVSGTGQPRIALGVGEDASHFRNPLLPDTRSEMTLPLHVGTEVIGVLDIHSHKTDAFNQDDIRSFQILADLLAIAIENARLIDRLNHTVIELEQAQGHFTREAWQTFLSRKQQTLGYRYSRKQVQPLLVSESDGQSVILPSEAWHALELGHSIIKEGKRDFAADSTDSAKVSTLAIPIKLREEVIGVLNMRFEDNTITPELISLVEEATSRLGVVLESARLLQEAQRLAVREQQINVIATQVRGSINLETVLQNTVRELGKAIGANRTYIQIGAIPTSSSAKPDSAQSSLDDNGKPATNPLASDERQVGRAGQPSGPIQENENIDSTSGNEDNPPGVDLL